MAFTLNVALSQDKENRIRMMNKECMITIANHYTNIIQ